MPKATASESAPGEPASRAELAADLPFEAALSRLEQVVDRLENGDLELEESLEVFEQGVGLSRRCAAQLDAAEQKVEILMREGGALVARAFADQDRDQDQNGDAADEQAPDQDQDQDQDGDWE